MEDEVNSKLIGCVKHKKLKIKLKTPLGICNNLPVIGLKLKK